MEKIGNNSPVMTIVSAIPRSGKSVWSEKYKKETNALICSADMLRTSLLGNKGDMTKEKYIWEQFEKLLDNMIADRNNIIVDNTNISKKARKNIISKAKEAGYIVNGVHIKTKMETIMKRCEETNFPKEVVLSMKIRFQDMDYLEGFDHIKDVSGE